MSRAAASVFSFLFLIVAPGSIAGAIPYALSGWRVVHAILPLQALGVLVIAASLAMLLECFARFAVQGRGTPAPLAPPTKLVVSGPYRRTRNPMYVAVVGLVLGEAALLGDLRLLAYAAVVWLFFHLFVLAYEEPTLRDSFPEEYRAFFAAVPRWRPRLTPWSGS